MTGHIPPGYFERAFEFDWTDYANDRMEKVLEEFDDIVMGYFHGHDHSDAIRLHTAAGPGGKPTVVSYLAPAGAPLSQNPGFRSYQYDRATFEILDLTQYYVDLDKANAEQKITWEREYSAKEYFGMESLKPEAWEQLHQQFLSNDTAFQRFSRINYVQYDLLPCGKACKATMLCGCFAVTTAKHKACMASFGHATEEQAAEAQRLEDLLVGRDKIRTHMPFAEEAQPGDAVDSR